MLCRVLPADMSRPVQVDSFWVAEVEARATPAAVKVAEKLTRVPSGVLKRVAKTHGHTRTRVLICRAGESTQETIEAELRKLDVKEAYSVQQVTLMDQIAPMQVPTGEQGCQRHADERVAAVYQDSH